MAYLWLKAFHIVGVVAWFAALFYLVRLFVYHLEAGEKPEVERRILEAQFGLMERRLYGIIGHPAMLLTLLTAVGLLALQPAWLGQRWLRAKLVLVAGLIGYHFLCGWVMRRLAGGRLGWSSRQLRALNEVPTLLLVVVVLLVVFKDTLPTIGVAVVVGALTLLIAVGIRRLRPSLLR